MRICIKFLEGTLITGNIIINIRIAVEKMFYAGGKLVSSWSVEAG